MTWTLELPWDKPLLTANQRLHHMARARTVKKIRTAAAWLAKAHIPAGLDHITVCLHYQPTTNRRRDADNLVPTLKALCDGLVDAGIVPDDTPEWMGKLMPVIHKAEKGVPPRLWLTVKATASSPADPAPSLAQETPA